MDPELLMESIAKELQHALKGMSKAESLEEKKQYSDIVVNLSQSFTGFLSLAGDMLEMDPDDYDNFEDA